MVVFLLSFLGEESRAGSQIEHFLSDALLAGLMEA
jgi:hypothetical protein